MPKVGGSDTMGGDGMGAGDGAIKFGITADGSTGDDGTIVSGV